MSTRHRRINDMIREVLVGIIDGTLSLVSAITGTVAVSNFPTTQPVSGTLTGVTTVGTITNNVPVKSPTITWAGWKYEIQSDDTSEPLTSQACDMFTITALSGNADEVWLSGGTGDGTKGDELQAGYSAPIPYTGISNMNEFCVYGKDGDIVSGNYGVIS